MNNSFPRILLFLFAVHICVPEVRSQEALNFSQALDKHIEAISKRKLKELLSTVDDQVILILPDGSILESKKEYEQLHINWFAEPGWKMDIAVLEKQEVGEIGYVLIKYKYTEEGNPPVIRYTYLNMIFRKKSGNWLLVHDQNTRIEKP
jgi:ketosteroid isomerase-like protein